ncbi:Ig-like domain-containing protein [Mycobacterium sp.]|uniref:L,D-transpeptidase n=1 Tax=Mycobacterium sp. TaxID=1785 RepID=UPI0025CE6C0F|nr:Ig-like domain-containing protein [Mycobacterium sp.]
MAVTTVALSGCAGGHAESESSAAPVWPQPAVVTVSVADGAIDVDPVVPVQVSVDKGTLISLSMVNDAGKVVEGVVTPDRSLWKNTEPLGYGTTYTVTVTSRSATGVTATQTSMFTTVQPTNQTKVYLLTTGGHFLDDEGTYGVGTVVVAHFDEPIADRVAAERHLSVTTSPPATGSWYWVDDQNAHWRPERYYRPGTRVTVAATIYGVAVGDGLYGQEDSRVSFVIGDSHISVADDTTKAVSVYENGRLVRTMPTSMGMGGAETIAGRKVSFWTQPGVYTVMDKANPVVMDSSTYGLPINSRLGYKESINYATRISTDGVYLHELDSTVWAQGYTDVSHGCLNLNHENARWFYNFAVPGDVVEVVNSGGAPLQIWQNGDWSIPWEQWLRGSALRG